MSGNARREWWPMLLVAGVMLVLYLISPSLRPLPQPHVRDAVARDRYGGPPDGFVRVDTFTDANGRFWLVAGEDTIPIRRD